MPAPTSVAAFDSLCSDLAARLGSPDFGAEALDDIAAAQLELWRSWNAEEAGDCWGEAGFPTTQPMQAAYRDASLALGNLAFSSSGAHPHTEQNGGRFRGNDLDRYNRVLGGIVDRLRAALCAPSNT